LKGNSTLSSESRRKRREEEKEKKEEQNAEQLVSIGPISQK